MLEQAHVIVALISGIVWGFLDSFVVPAAYRRRDGLPGLPVLGLSEVWIAVTGSLIATIALAVLVAQPATWMIVVASVLGAGFSLRATASSHCGYSDTVIVHGSVVDDGDRAKKSQGLEPPYADPYTFCVLLGGDVEWKWNAPAQAINPQTNQPANVKYGRILFDQRQRLPKGFDLADVLKVVFGARFRPFDKGGQPLKEHDIELTASGNDRVTGSGKLEDAKRHGKGNYTLQLLDAQKNVLVSQDPGGWIPKRG